jgi:PHD/YefM family antitoxin component YafN of YafNO toxin-antitoxin module
MDVFESYNSLKLEYYCFQLTDYELTKEKRLRALEKLIKSSSYLSNKKKILSHISNEDFLNLYKEKDFEVPNLNLLKEIADKDFFESEVNKEFERLNDHFINGSPYHSLKKDFFIFIYYVFKESKEVWWHFNEEQMLEILKSSLNTLKDSDSDSKFRNSGQLFSYYADILSPLEGNTSLKIKKTDCRSFKEKYLKVLNNDFIKPLKKSVLFKGSNPKTDSLLKYFCAIEQFSPNEKESLNNLTEELIGFSCEKLSELSNYSSTRDSFIKSLIGIVLKTETEDSFLKVIREGKLQKVTINLNYYIEEMDTEEVDRIIAFLQNEDLEKHNISINLHGKGLSLTFEDNTVFPIHEMDKTKLSLRFSEVDPKKIMKIIEESHNENIFNEKGRIKEDFFEYLEMRLGK